MIKVGDKVKERPVLKRHRNKKGFVGIITRVDPCNPNNPIEDHGTVEVKILEMGTMSPYLEIGDLEHYTHSKWEMCLKIIPPEQT